MTITLTPQQTRWLEEQVEAGAFPSVDAAVRQAVEQLIAEQTTPPDADWQTPEGIAELKALIDEARAEFARGEFIEGNVVRAELDEYIRRHS